MNYDGALRGNHAAYFHIHVSAKVLSGASDETRISRVRRSIFVAVASLSTTNNEGGVAMKRTDVPQVLYCELQGDQLNVDAFEYDGKITASRMCLKWEGGGQDLPFGNVHKFGNAKFITDYMKTYLIPGLVPIVPDFIKQVLSSARINVRILPMSLQGEITKNSGCHQ